MKTKVVANTLMFAFLSCFLAGCTSVSPKGERKPVVVAYVGGYKGLVDENKISPEKITHINYAFVDVVNGKAFLTNEATDTVNFRKLNSLKKKNPDLKILISIGGWTWSRQFSDAVLTPEGRKAFARSAAGIMKAHHLDGIDIDWEYPAIAGYKENIYRPEDKQNYTLMFAEIRASLDSLQKADGRKYLLTTAVGAFPKFIEHTEMDKVQQYLDFVNLMTYDYHPDSLAVHHTNLYTSSRSGSKLSADSAVQQFIRAGVPVGKLVMGIAFYGRAFRLAADARDGIGDPVSEQIKGRGFTFIKDSLENKINFNVLWDDEAKAPYLFNKPERIFVTYDNEASAGAKCGYVVDKGMAGVMFWEYSSDPKEYLLDIINQELYGKCM